MERPHRFRALVAICGVFAVLLAVLAVVQYRWSTRVATADAQREREHLDSAASLFVSDFNSIVGQAADFLENDGRAALESGGTLAGIPKLISELYYLDFRNAAAPQAKRLTSEGVFTPVPAPEWATVSRCGAGVIEQPAAFVTPIYKIFTENRPSEQGLQIFKTIRGRIERCFVARIDQAYLREKLIPQLLHQSFGGTAESEYDFGVVWNNRPHHAVYGAPRAADLRKPFFSLAPRLPALPNSAAGSVAHGNAVYILRRETLIGKSPGSLLGPGIWTLEVAHKGIPLAVAFEQRRRRDLLLSLGVEMLLFVAIVFLVIGSRRMQRLADQKVQFVAGVSHELRTPISAIGMLARNQADGLVAGADKVKQYGELIHQQSQRLNEMIEQTLQYAGIHSGRRPVKDELDLRRLIETAVDARRQELERSGFEIEVDVSPDLPALQGDAGLLRTALDNLLSNAQKHAGRGHWIRVSACYSTQEREVTISVEDRGSGIDPADQADIFEPFCRGRAALEAQIPGSGLGLSLVRGAAEAHRGSVTLESEPGHGSIFTLHLPA